MYLFLFGTLQNLTGKKASDPVPTRITTGVYFGNSGVDIMATATHVVIKALSFIFISFVSVPE